MMNVRVTDLHAIRARFEIPSVIFVLKRRCFNVYLLDRLIDRAVC